MASDFEQHALDRTRKPDDFLRMIRRSQRGRLKIYLGYAAGVGKTYQMLREAHRLKDDGIDVVVGYVETHGRVETQRLVEGLELIPRRRIEYRGIGVEEMDVDAILRRKPAVVLIDELAHTNAPDSRNAKRYDDVRDVLQAGIHVISTLNIQHVESLYETVERATGVKVRERLPDAVLAEADQIVNVDVSAEDLRGRLREGKVYTAERVETALDHFFKESNLERLRELTLRELASHIDLRQREPSEEDTSAAPDQVMVCLSSRGPNSEQLLRYGSRLAGRLNRTWYAVYVQTPAEAATVIDAQTQRRLSGALTLAKQLGAMVFTYKGEDVVKTILQFAREYRAGHIVIGSPGTTMPWWRRVLGHRSVAERLINAAKGHTVVVIDTRPADELEPAASESVEAAAPVRNGSVPASPAARLADFLTEETTLVLREPVTRDEVLAQLAEAACQSAGIPGVKEVLDAILAREEQGSTFFNAGVAFPHARIAELDVPVLALGITQGGVRDVSTVNPIEWVALILTPKTSPSAQVELLAAVSKRAQDARLVEALRSVKSPQEALHLLQEMT